MKNEIKYIELKSGYSDNGPAWIGKVKISRTGNTIYFDDKAFEKRALISGNYRDIETGEEYWISGVKKNASDRHWAGTGKVMIDKSIVDNYLEVIGSKEIPKNLILVEIPEIYPIERIKKLLNDE